MPRRPAKVTQADIARVIRAAKEAGADEVVIDVSGQIRISLHPAPVTSGQESNDTVEWQMSAPATIRQCTSREADAILGSERHHHGWP